MNSPSVVKFGFHGVCRGVEVEDTLSQLENARQLGADLKKGRHCVRDFDHVMRCCAVQVDLNEWGLVSRCWAFGLRVVVMTQRSSLISLRIPRPLKAAHPMLNYPSHLDFNPHVSSNCGLWCYGYTRFSCFRLRHLVRESHFFMTQVRPW
jgi:hypothetical protein